MVISANMSAGTSSITLQAPNDRIQQTAGTMVAGNLVANADYEITISQIGNQFTGRST